MSLLTERLLNTTQPMSLFVFYSENAYSILMPATLPTLSLSKKKPRKNKISENEKKKKRNKVNENIKSKNRNTKSLNASRNKTE